MFYHTCSVNSDKMTFNGGKLDFKVEGYALTFDWPSSLLEQGFSSCVHLPLLEERAGSLSCSEDNQLQAVMKLLLEQPLLFALSFGL